MARPSATSRSALARDYPRLEPLLRSLAFAVEEEYTARDHVLHDGNEVALIPPISGGCDD